MHLPLALSIHHFISSVGADAGFAAIIGLAILVLLYFAQARETTTLRDEAVAASQRVEQLERRVAAMGAPAVAPPPGGTAPGAGAGVHAGSQPPASSAAQQAAPSGPSASGVAGPSGAGARPPGTPAASGTAHRAAAASGGPMAAAQSSGAASGGPMAAAQSRSIPAAPAGMGAPALIDATRLIPAPTGPAEGQGAHSSQGAQSPQTAVAAGAAPRTAAAAGVATPPPATAAAGAGLPPAGDLDGTGEQAQPSPTSPAGPRSLPPRFQLRPDPAGYSGARQGRRRGRPVRWLPALAGVLLLAAVVAVLLVVTATGSSTHHAAGTSSTNAPSTRRSHAGFVPSSVTVAVLNGTDVSQLAHRVAQKLARSGYRQGTVATAADQTHSSTIVAYLPGFQSDASYVAGSLGLTSSAVQPVGQSARAIACPPPATSCRANVIVTVGSDLANSR